MPYRFRSEHPMNLSSITVSFRLACRAPVGAARTDTANAGTRAVGEYTDIRLDCVAGK